MPQPTLHRQADRLADPATQLKLLNQLQITSPKPSNFSNALQSAGWSNLTTDRLDIFQINIGKLCNMSCRHCHVDAGPDRTTENMDRATIDACLTLLDQTTATTVDITGGAPELNPHFRYLVDACIERGKQVIDRCNLTVLLLPGCRDLPQWLADRNVEIVCSLPHYRQRNTDSQRGDGTYEKSIEALRQLNQVGYGQGDPQRRLTLVTNPVGAYLPSHQPSLEQEWKTGLAQHQNISFDRLIALTNMPISRYLHWLETSGNLTRYMEILINSFNPATLPGLMCRNTLSIGWDGQIYDCDFNQMLNLPSISQPQTSQPLTIHNIQPKDLVTRAIRTDRHCFGCTAGAGSSCGGAIEE
jgi:radical SAM/Cys-rich protein